MIAIKMLLSFLTAFLVCYLMIPFVIKFAHVIGAIDVPKDNRRVHTEPIPRLGGMGIAIAFMVSTLIFCGVHRELISILFAATIVLVTGVFDDTRDLSAKLKLIIQIICAGIVVYSGVQIDYVANPFTGHLIWLGYWGVPISIVWIVGVTNCINLIDGLDGLAAGISSIAALTLATVSLIHGYYNYATIFFCLAGASIGFLPHNFNPAKIFMGDTGSLFLGFILSVMAIEGTVKSTTLIAVIVPVLALAVPIFDTAFAIIRRKLAGKPIMQADKGHLHHRLLAKGLSQRQTVLVLYAASAILGASAVLITHMKVIYGILIIIVDFMFIGYSVYRLKILHHDQHDVEK